MWTQAVPWNQFTKLIQGNWFENGFSVNTPTERWNKAIKLHACPHIYNVQTHTQRHAHTLTHTHTSSGGSLLCQRSWPSHCTWLQSGMCSHNRGDCSGVRHTGERTLWRLPLWSFSVKGKLIIKFYSISRNTTQNTENNNSDVSVTYGCLHKWKIYTYRHAVSIINRRRQP